MPRPLLRWLLAILFFTCYPLISGYLIQSSDLFGIHVKLGEPSMGLTENLLLLGFPGLMFTWAVVIMSESMEEIFPNYPWLWLGSRRAAFYLLNACIGLAFLLLATRWEAYLWLLITSLSVVAILFFTFLPKFFPAPQEEAPPPHASQEPTP